MKTGRATVLKYGITTFIAGLITFFIARGRYPDAGAAASEKYRALCDAFTVSAVLLLAFGALLWVSGEGVFLGIGWAVKNAVLILIPGQALNRESYAEYRARKLSTGKASGFGFLFIVGAVFLAVALVFLVLYNKSVWKA